MTITLSEETRKLWQHAIDTVNGAETRFLKAYQATLDELFANWQRTWKTDAGFPLRLADVEEFVKTLCTDRGMRPWTFRKYCRAARATVVLGMPFNLGKQFTARELLQIRSGRTTPQKIKRTKRIRYAQNVVEKTAAILPLPAVTSESDPATYIATVKQRLLGFLSDARERLSQDNYEMLIDELRICLVASDGTDALVETVAGRTTKCKQPR